MSSTSAKARSRPSRYRKTAPNSHVDETLFSSQKPANVSSRSATDMKNRSQSKGGEMIQIITKDLIRNLRIPRQDPSGGSTILPAADFQRMTSGSHVLLKEEREAIMHANQVKKEEKFKASEERKQMLYKKDLLRKENRALTELELEAQDKAQRVVDRANVLRMEQEDEIKRLNRLIDGATCQATRNEQIQEKKLIQEEMAQEEKRLDAIMEVERRKALETVAKIDELRREKMIRGKQQIYDQIQKHVEEKQMQDEIKDQERQQIQEKQERMNMEDRMALEKKREDQRLLQEEIMRINSETMQAKELRMEQEKLADLRDLEFIQKKMERDAEYEAEQRRVKKEKELEIARLRAQQEKARDFKAEKDELRARRNQEAMEREWRRKEKELAVKKAEEESRLRAARLEQVLCKEHCLSIEAKREKAEFERVLKVQQEAIIKQKEQEEMQHEKAQGHLQAIRQQMQERELSAIAKRRENFKEADRFVEEARQRRLRLDEFKEKKLKELKATGLSDKYCSEVERKAWAGLV